MDKLGHLYIRDDESNFNDDYREKDSQFNQLGVTMLRQKLLKQIAQDSPIKHPGMEEEIPRFARLLHLTTIELVYWELLLNATSSIEREMSIPFLYAFSAYLAKTSLNYDVSVYENQLCRCISSFKLRYENWLLVTNCPVEANLFDLSQRFKQMLSHDHQYTNYEELVSHLIQPAKPDLTVEESDEDEKLKDFHDYMRNEELPSIYDPSN